MITLTIPIKIPILFTRDKSSLKYKTPTRTTIIRFRIVIIEIALDKNSYFNEKAHITVAKKYTITPRKKTVCFPLRAHFFKITSPEASNIAATMTKIKKIDFKAILDGINIVHL